VSERDGYEHGVPCWVAAVHPDPAAAARFYAELFGWETKDLMPPGSGESYTVCRVDGRDVAALVSNGPAPAPPKPMWGTHMWVDSADETTETARAAGGSVIAEPFDSPGGGRVAVIADPAGAAFCLWEPQGRKGAQRVNERSAWAMSLLATPDTETAASFYGELFGWTTESFGPTTLFRLPGYEGGEPEQPVSREVVAAMIGGEAPAHWAVDFWIDDADRAAERTAALGGEVIATPHDVPNFKRAVLADPQGATFSVSQLVRVRDATG
jgi:predicted enzyme related to lactoylglutathione lyase